MLARPRRIRNPENTPPHRWRACNAGPYKQKASPAQKHTQPFLLYSRGEHCSPAKALCCRKAPRVEQSPTPTINRKRVREIFIALSQFHRRGGAWLRPGLPNAGSCGFAPHPHRTPPPSPHPQPRKYTPAPLAGLQCRPLQAKGEAHAKTPPPFLLYSRGEHCSPALAERRPLRFAPYPHRTPPAHTEHPTPTPQQPIPHF